MAAALSYLGWISVGLAVLWLVGYIDDWLIAREQRLSSKD